MIQGIAVTDVALMVIIAAVLVITGCLVAVLVWVRRTAVQSERLLSQVNDALPEILREIRRTSENVRIVSTRARESAEETRVLVQAVGDVGRTVNRVHDVLHEKGATVMGRLMQVVSGIRAMASTVSDRIHKGGGKTNG